MLSCYNSMFSAQHLTVDKSQNIIMWSTLTPFRGVRRVCVHVWGSLWGSTDRCWKRQLCLCWRFSSFPQWVCWWQAGNTSVRRPPSAWRHFPPHAVQHMRSRRRVKNTLISWLKKDITTDSGILIDVATVIPDTTKDLSTNNDAINSAIIMTVIQWC